MTCRVGKRRNKDPQFSWAVLLSTQFLVPCKEEWQTNWGYAILQISSWHIDGGKSRSRNDPPNIRAAWQSKSNWKDNAKLIAIGKHRVVSAHRNFAQMSIVLFHILNFRNNVQREKLSGTGATRLWHAVAAAVNPALGRCTNVCISNDVVKIQNS